MLQDIVTAARTYDRPATEEHLHRLIAGAHAGQPFEERPLREALTELRNNRWFDLLRATGDALILAGETRPSIRKLYAQGLIDTGVIAASVPFLEQLAGESAGYQRGEAFGLLGRAWKQAYVSGDALSQALAKKLLERSIANYYKPYKEKPDDPRYLYQAINTVAMLCRAKRDGFDVGSEYPDPRELATTIRRAVEDLRAEDQAKSWDYATAAEASVALGEWQQALEWLNRYIPNSTAFEIAGTLRQFVEVWRLSATDDERGGPLIHLLEAEMLHKRGGESVDASASRASMQALDRQSDQLQAVLGNVRYVTIDWYRTGLARSMGVARIGSLYNTIGTGFLVEIDGQQLFVTNHHVVPRRVPSTSAYVVFDGLEGNPRPLRMAEQLWTSPVEELDATIVRLDRPVPGVAPYPLCPALPPLEPESRVYIIGHPNGGAMSFSIADNVLLDHLDPKLHYRAPTDRGSSGSPVFDENWSLLALHRLGGPKTRKLRGDGQWAANEGLYFNAVLERFRART